jgi:hypothetical protein
MRLPGLSVLLGCFAIIAVAGPITAQSSAVFPPSAFKVHTVAVMNETHNAGVMSGATEALKDWGHWKQIDDPMSADLVLDFGKKSDHSGSSSDRPATDGKPSYSYSMSFSSKIEMSATTKDGFNPFYTTTTSEDKQKAGRACVQSFISAY